MCFWQLSKSSYEELVHIGHRENYSKEWVMVENKLPMQRRLKTTMLVLISQALLVALAISWVVHMAFIAANGSVNFVENNNFILWSEIIGSALIAIFAILILTAQIQRLGERRADDRRDETRNSSQDWTFLSIVTLDSARPPPRNKQRTDTTTAYVGKLKINELPHSHR